MGFNIGSVLSSLNIPSLNLGNIGSDILAEGKSLLGDVVKDSFTLSNSNQPGQTFASTMNLDVGGSNLSLPNPIGALANKLLGGVDSELNKFGVNVDFKTVAKDLFNLPTQSGGTVSVPSAASRATTGGVPTSPAEAVASTHYAATNPIAGLGGGGAGTPAVSSSTGTSSPAVINAGGISSSSYTAPTGGTDASSVINGMLSPAENLYNQANSDLANAGTDPAKLQVAAQEMQQANEAFSMISDMLKDAHDTRMTMINNMAQ